MARTDALMLLTVDLNVLKEIATVFFLLVFVVVCFRLYGKRDDRWSRHARLPLEDGVITRRNDGGSHV